MFTNKILAMKVAKRIKEKVHHKCIHCGNPLIRPQPDAYRSELYGDKTPIWICNSCNLIRYQDI